MAPRVLGTPRDLAHSQRWKEGQLWTQSVYALLRRELAPRSGRFGDAKSAVFLLPRLRSSASRRIGAEKDRATVSLTILRPLMGGFTKGRPFCFV
jgi:hypothetical protein